jgi:predicted RNA-binding Zn-ribbon protein involved in translation (DUF1610 family)
MLCVSTIRHCRDTFPTDHLVSVGELFEKLTTFRRAPRGGKDYLPAWIPARFDGKRSKKTVIEVSCFVLDIDDGTTIAQGMALWPQYQRAMHTSWSHSSGLPKFRLVFPLAEPVPAPRWKAAWGHLAAEALKAGVKLDPKCKNPDRIYYLPAINPERSERAAVAFTEGDLLRVDWRSLPDVDRVRRALNQRFVPRTPGQRDYRDPMVREQLAGEIGAHTDGERAFHGRCPQCGERSVWFLLEPDRWLGAKCNHEKTCGWEGPLRALEGA